MALTPNAEAIRALIREYAASDDVLSALLARTAHRKWPIGHTKCKKKSSGSGNWSDHSWSNALDVQVLTLWDDPDDPAKGIVTPGETHYLDRLWGFVSANTIAWDLDPHQMLYRVSKHWTHFHMSWNHKGTGTPPCAGGTLKTLNPPNGFILTAAIGDTQPPDPPDDEGHDVKVSDLQKVLTDAGFDPGPIDGIYGPLTHAAWVSMMTNASADTIGDHTHGGVKR